MQPRIRTVKPEFYIHEYLYDAEKDFDLPLRLAFSGLWTCCDREGRFEWRPRTLKAAILPHDDIDFSRVLDALMSRGFVVKYRVNDKHYGCIPSWKNHQVINNRERLSVLPEPTEKSISDAGFDASPTRDPRSLEKLKHAQAEGKGREGKGIDKNIGAKNDASSTRDPPVKKIELPDFVDTNDWTAFVDQRKKIRKPMTEEAMKRALKKLTDFHEAGHDIKKIMAETIDHAWQTFYLPRHGGAYAKPTNSNGSIGESVADMHHRLNTGNGRLFGSNETDVATPVDTTAFSPV